MGGYGYYYQASLEKLDLTKRQPIKDSTSDVGSQVAIAFQQSVGTTKIPILKSTSITKDQLRELGRKACLCQISSPSSLERELVQKVMFAQNGSITNDSGHILRRETLATILHIISFLETCGGTLTERIFLDGLFYNQIDLGSSIVTYAPPIELSNVSDKWKIFRAHDYFKYACEALFASFLKSLDAHINSGLTLDAFLNEIFSRELTTNVAAILSIRRLDDLKTVSLHDAVSRFCAIPNFDAPTSRLFECNTGLSSNLNESKLTLLLDEGISKAICNAADFAAIGIVLSFLLFARFLHRQLSRDGNWNWLSRRVSRNTDNALSTFVLEIGSKLQSSILFRDFAEWFFKSHIIDQATLVFLEKMESASYSRPISWFTKDGQVYRKDRDYLPGFANSRFNNTLQILIRPRFSVKSLQIQPRSQAKVGHN